MKDIPLPDVPASPMSFARATLRLPVALLRAGAEQARDVLALTRRALTRRDRGRTRPADLSTRRILLVDDLVPDPRFGAGYPRAFAIVQALVKAGHQVSFYPMASTRTDIARLSDAFAGAVSFHAGRGARGLRRLLWTEGDSFDVLFISRPSPMRAFVKTGWHRHGDSSRPAIIYDAEAVLSPREARRRALFGTAWSATEYQAALDAELGLARGATSVTAVSPQDAQTIESVLSIPVFVLPHPVTTTPDVPPFADRKDFLFVGRLTGAASESPNVDSIRWFVTEIMPVLDRMLDDYTLHIVGLFDCPDLDQLVSERVVRHGVVEDLAPLYDRCRVFIAPTRYAAGIPLKVIEAMGRGIPCVATPLLAEQLSATHEELPTGESPQHFAAQCARLYCDPEAWRTGSAAGRSLVERAYSQDAFDRVLAEVIDPVDRRHAAA